MTDNVTPPEGTEETTTTQDVGTQTTSASDPVSVKDLPPNVQALIDDLRRENAKHRTEKRKAEDAAKKAEEKRLVEQQQWQTLAEQRGTQLAELETLKAKAETLEEAFNTALEARLKSIPADVRKSLVEPVRATMSAVEFSLWLDTNQSVLGVRPAPKLDAGAQGSGGSSSTVAILSDAEKKQAKLFGMTEAQYVAKYKAKKPSS